MKQPTVAELWTRYELKHLRKVADPQSVLQSWKNLRQFFGCYRPATINQDMIDNYERARMTGLFGRRACSGTIRRELAALMACLRWCADPKRKLLAPANLPLIDLPADSVPRDRWLTKAETETLLEATYGRVKVFAMLALHTGARKQAILDLTWDRVDWESSVIHFAVPGLLETKKRRASVPMSKALRAFLNDYYPRSRPEQRTVVPAGPDPYHELAKVAERAGISGVTPHVLRHTAATHMARAGVPLWQIAGVLGNTTAMVEKVYAKHAPDGLVGAVECIG